MLKKYLPFIILIAALLIFFWIKKNQRGKPLHSIISTPAVIEPFERNINSITYSKHARCRMECRKIDDSEVKEILEKGTINYSKIEVDARGKTYPLEGTTHDQQNLRIVFALHENELLVVTVIDLDKEWHCDCD